MTKYRCIKKCFHRHNNAPKGEIFNLGDYFEPGPEEKVSHHFLELKTAGRPPNVEPNLKQLNKEQLHIYAKDAYDLDLNIDLLTKKEMIREIEAAKKGLPVERPPENKKDISTESE